MNKSLDSCEFKETFLEFFSHPKYSGLKDKISAIDWEGRFYNTGLPPKPDFDTSLVDVCYALAEKWKSEDYKPNREDMDGWFGNQMLVFLNVIQDFPEPLSVSQVQSLGETYEFLTSKNVELKAAYYEIAMRAEDPSVYGSVAELLGSVGRMKFVRPLYRSLDKVDRDLALKTFEKNRDFYHPICRQMVEKDLRLAEAIPV
jgi:leukotriene-A4 hydrolase